MKAAEDFLLVILHSHIIASAETILKDSPNDTVEQLATSKYVKLWKTDCGESVETDRVYVYACDIVTLGLL